jgi:hypothetical protein
MEVEQQTETRGRPNRGEHAVAIPRERRNGEGAAGALASTNPERPLPNPKPLEGRPSV